MFRLDTYIVKAELCSTIQQMFCL